MAYIMENGKVKMVHPPAKVDKKSEKQLESASTDTALARLAAKKRGGRQQSRA